MTSRRKSESGSAGHPSASLGTQLTPRTQPPAWNGFHIRVRGVHWHVRPGWESLVCGATAPNWLHLVAESGAEPVKRNTAREVWRVTVADQEFFVKIYHERGIAGKLRAMFRGPGCLLEWRAGEHAYRHQIGTVEPVAYGLSGWRGAFGPCVLITRSLREATPLHVYWQNRIVGGEPDRRRRSANALIDAAAEALAKAHQGGFHHRDLHAGNLLVTAEADVRPEVVFVDLHDVRVGPRVPDQTAIRNLAQLNQWFRRHATQTDRLRFLRHYVETREELSRRTDSGPGLRLDYRGLLKALDIAADRHSRSLWSKRDRTALRDNKYFARLRAPNGWRGHVFLRAKHPVPGSRASYMQFTRAEWQKWLNRPLEWIRTDRTDLIKDSHTASICRGVLPTGEGPLDVVCKQARPRTWWKGLYYLFTDSRNLRTYRKGYQLINRDLPTARPLAVMERRFAGLLLDSMVMTEAIPNAKDFDALLRVDLPGQEPRVQRRVKDELIEELARLVKNLQARGFAHRDFKASNLMVQWDPSEGQPPRLTLVDLDGLLLRRRLSLRDRLRPLMRLNVSMDEARLVTRTDRLRFLKAYLRGFTLEHSNWKLIWQLLAEMSRSKRLEKERRLKWKMQHYGRP